MKNYPNLSKLDKADHLLFDIGYSAALLFMVKELLQTIAECDDYPLEVDELLEAIQEFESKRLSVRSEIYDNAAEAAKRACNPMPNAS